MTSLPKIKGIYKRNFSLSKLTWFQTGGKAEILFIPKDLLDLQFFLKNIKNTSINIIGGGSNLLIRDGGIKGIVIKLGSGFDFVNLKKKYILCGASVKNINLSNKMTKRKIKGYEFLSTIPGTIGGSIFMNAGCFGREIKNLVKSVIVLDKKGNLIELDKNSINFKYRSSGINKNYFIVATKLKISKGNETNIRKIIKKFLNLRKKTQPNKVLTGGSTFINPKRKKAWKLIKDAGCENMFVGGAKISDKHCNFLVNTGSANSKDLETLGNKIRSKVFKKTGEKLDWEIKRIGVR
ncbi:MAG: UDP-N-acetylenolpyruvoylglucosamine reductase [Pelagibacteraceae bacterium]|nr:UDP-N-acetylenolpyruvoylglucosamine reductase [Pelagibacteraceae bacterium]